MTYTTAAKLEARMGSDAFLRAFDRDGDGIADGDVVDSAILAAETTINAMLAASHTTPFDPVPQHIEDIANLLAPWEAVQWFPGNAATAIAGPYKGAHDRALKLLEALAKDNRARLPATVPAPTRDLTVETPTVIDSATPWSDVRAGKTRSAF